jgi:ATP-binding cassette subfamily G (WHITE) protein 2
MKKGMIIYQGNCQKSVSFLESTTNSKMPGGSNPADFLIDCLTKGESPESEAMDRAAKLKPPVDLTMGSGLSFYSKEFTMKVWFTQYFTLLKRCFQKYIRRSDIIYMNLLTVIIMSIFISFGTWYQIGNKQDSIAKRVPSLFFCCVCQGIVAALQCISSFPLERAIILRERAAGAYYVSAYFLAKSTVDIFSVTWGPCIFCAIVYPSIGYQGNARKFFIYLMFMLMDSLSALSLATLVACVCVSVEMSTVVLSILLEITRLYGGFFISPLQLEDNKVEGWKFANALSYLTYCFMGVTVNELTGLELTCTASDIANNSCYTTGEQIMKSKGYDEFTIGYCVGIGCVYIFGCRLFSFLALRYNDK